MIKERIQEERFNEENYCLRVVSYLLLHVTYLSRDR